MNPKLESNWKFDDDDEQIHKKLIQWNIQWIQWDIQWIQWDIEGINKKS